MEVTPVCPSGPRLYRQLLPKGKHVCEFWTREHHMATTPPPNRHDAHAETHRHKGAC